MRTTRWFAYSLLSLGFVATLAMSAQVLTAAEPAADSTADGLTLVAAREKMAKENPLDWSQWRGNNRDARSQETDLLKEWPKDGPKLLWTNDGLGMGYSGPAIVKNKLYIQGTDGDNATVVFCIDMKNGKTLWKTPIGAVYNNGWGDGPRGTPTVDGNLVYALSGVGDLVCLNANTGKKIWAKNLVSDFGGKVQSWGYSESPLIDGNRVVVTPGGSQCFVALNKKNGDLIWSSTGLDDAAQYSSIIKGSVGKVPMYMNMVKGGLVGISAEDGRFLWRFEKTGNPTAVIPTPIYQEPFVYSTSGYGTGCGLVKLTADGSNVNAEEVYFNKTMKNHHGGVLLQDGHIYGYSDGVGWLCQKLDDGEMVWRERKALDKGSVAFADGMLYCYGEEDGTCVLAEATTEGWTEKGRFTIPQHTAFDRKKGKVWTHPVIADGKLFLRDQEFLFCFDIGK